MGSEILTQFLNRTDRLASQAPWGSPCPIEVNGNLDELLDAHLGRGTAEATYLPARGAPKACPVTRLGTYAPDLEGRTRWLCFDLDGPEHSEGLKDPLALARDLLSRLSELHVPAHLEKSGGGRGWHVWVLLTESMPASMVRRLAFAILPERVELASGEMALVTSGRGVEVFPKQDRVKPANEAEPAGMGSMVWLPLWGGAEPGCGLFHKEVHGLHVPYKPESLERADPAVVSQFLESLPAPKQPEPEERSESSDLWRVWRRDALARLPLESVYGELLTGKKQSPGWLECRDPESPSGDRDPSACVADGTGRAERGAFKSFRVDGRPLSVFDFLQRHRGARDFIEAARWVSEWSGVALPPSKSRQLKAKLEQTLASMDRDELEIVELLEAAGVDPTAMHVQKVAGQALRDAGYDLKKIHRGARRWTRGASADHQRGASDAPRTERGASADHQRGASAHDIARVPEDGDPESEGQLAKVIEFKRPTVPGLLKISLDPYGRVNLDINSNGTPEYNVSVMDKIVLHDALYGGKLTRNEIDLNVYFDGQIAPESFVHRVRSEVTERYGFTKVVPKQDVNDAILSAAEANTFNPLRRYLEDLRWDGIKRIERIPEVLGVRDEDLELATIYTRRWFVGAIARALRPGCQLDTVFCLLGNQGAFKSSFFRILGGDFFADTFLDIQNMKDTYLQLHGAWIYELAEMESVYQKADAGKMRQLITSQTDRFRAPYERGVRPHKRYCVMVGTSNRPDLLSDPEGNRRFWVLRVGDRIDKERVLRERDMLWAEARAIFESGERWWLTDHEEALRRSSNARFEVERPGVDLFLTAIAEIEASPGFDGTLTMNELLAKAGFESDPRAGFVLGYSRPKPTMGQQRDAGHALRKAGYERKPSRNLGEATIWVRADP
ncbi:MAG: hypothetical protein HY791_03020 [Deltaproteobacteria bacterium]|nr:hypothetical protein [Deltaproteobacteria bacterium]